MKYYMISETGSVEMSGKPSEVIKRLLEKEGFKKCSQQEYLKKREWQRKEDIKETEEIACFLARNKETE